MLRLWMLGGRRRRLPWRQGRQWEWLSWREGRVWRRQLRLLLWGQRSQGVEGLCRQQRLGHVWGEGEGLLGRRGRLRRRWLGVRG